jgi:1-pyrroline-5-carboxylate dehydrogenase
MLRQGSRVFIQHARCLSSSSSSSIGRFKVPEAVGEVFRHYEPESPDGQQLAAACVKVRATKLEIPCVVNGKEYYTGNTFDQVVPSDHGHVLATVHQATPEIVKEAIAVSQEARKEWGTMDAVHRTMVFRKAADLIAGKYRYDIMATTMLGQGKTVWQAEIDSTVETIDFLRLNSTYMEEIYAVQPPLNSPNTWNRLEYRELEGFVLAVSPFNFTAIGANLVAAPAIMGNTVLWKPSPSATLSNYLVYNIFLEAGLPEGVISFLPCTPEGIQPALNDPALAGLHFTGSTATFNTLWKQIGNNLDTYRTYPRIVGETGGKNFHIIHPSAEREHVAYSTVRGAFEYQGQKCSACSRMYVPKSMWEGGGLKDLMVSVTKSLRMGQSDDFKSFMSAVIDRAAFDKHVRYLNALKESKEVEILVGGGHDDSVGFFIEPTVAVVTDPHFATMQEEIFGPVLTVYVYDDSRDGAWEDVCKLADTTSPYGLTGGIFSKDRAALQTAADILRHACGNMYWNDKSTGAVVGEQPFGGSRVSGTNDKAGSHLNLLRWTSVRTIKETTTALTTHTYPHMK